MKLHQLRYFQEVCRQHSITKAAEELHISQPAVSAAIRELEEEFGLRLFKRSHKKLILTTEGSYFSLEVEELLQKAKQIADDMTRLQKKNTSIRVGLPPMIEALEIPLLALWNSITGIPCPSGRRSRMTGSTLPSSAARTGIRIPWPPVP